MGQITLQGVRKSFGPVNIIKDANLDIEDGSFVVFVGPSGCGKTTLLRLIAGLEDVTGGQILIDGKNVVDVPPVTSSRPAISRNSVVLPQPEGPTNTTKAPSSISRLASLMMLTGPKDFRTPCSVIWPMIPVPCYLTAPKVSPRTSCRCVNQPRMMIGAMASVEAADSFAQNSPS